jgi:hypothetical protein
MSSIYGIQGLWAGYCECDKFLEFLKLLEVIDMDGSFPMRRYT